MGRKLGVCPFKGGRAGSPSNTMWPGQRPTCVPSFILIRPTVWPQCTNVTDRQDRTDRKRSDSIGRTVLQTVAQKRDTPQHQFVSRSQRRGQVPPSTAEMAVLGWMREGSPPLGVGSGPGVISEINEILDATSSFQVHYQPGHLPLQNCKIPHISKT